MLQPSLSFEQWRDRARPLLIAGVEPALAAGTLAASTVAGTHLQDFGDTATTATRPLGLPAPLMRLLDNVSCFRTDGRYELMYRLAFRTLFENRRLLEDAADPDVRKAIVMDAAVRRDIHKMHAFVRFRELTDPTGEPAFFAWFEPEHEILRRGADFFVKRFPNMNWTIATPEAAAVWDQHALSWVASPGPNGGPASDGYEDLWRTYYRNICNVARLNPEVMQREMPHKYWKNLPEAAEIGLLIRDGLSNFEGRQQIAAEQADTMTRAVKRALAALPETGEGAQACRRCELWRHATQAVLGEGPANARVMLVGEQPGDEEDLRGQPFIGPAGRVLDQAMRAAGVERAAVYITNAVKHFKWQPRGKRRLHQKPDVRELVACSVWLEQEISKVKPAVIVALGASALRALTGSSLSVDIARRRTLTHTSGPTLVATYHPAAILRAEGEHASELRAALVQDLKRAGLLAGVPHAGP